MQMCSARLKDHGEGTGTPPPPPPPLRCFRISGPRSWRPLTTPINLVFTRSGAFRGEHSPAVEERR